MAVKCLVKFTLLIVFLWQLFQDGLQGEFQLISRLGLRLEFMVLFRHGTPDMMVQRIQIRRVWMPLFLLSEPGTVIA